MNGLVLFQEEIITKQRKYIYEIKKILFSTTGIIQLNLAKSFLDEGPRSFPVRDNHEIWNYLNEILNFFLQNHRAQFQTNFGTKNSWVTGIQVWSHEAPAI